MTIQLNGKTITLPEEVATVHDLLKHYQMENRIVIVELNKEIPGKEQYQTLFLNEGDKVEMIHFVGGG
jgi:sulfur carrier protein